MRSVPVPRSRNPLKTSLEATAVVVKRSKKFPRVPFTSKIMALYPAGKNPVSYRGGGRAPQISNSVSYSQISDLFSETEGALLMQVQRRRSRIQRSEAYVHILRAIIEKTGTQNVFWAEVVLQAEKIILRPTRGRVGVSGQLSDKVKVCCRLIASENQKRPRSMGPEKVKRGYQFPSARRLNIDARHWIGCAEAPFVVAVRRFQA